MRAALLERYGAPLRLIDIPDPIPGEGMVVVATRACGVCGSDIFLQKGGFDSTMPIVPGHEASGVIADIGPRVEGLEIGQPVAMYYIDFCGSCEMCTMGRVNMCLSVRRMGVDFNGAFAERVLIAAKSVIPVETSDTPAAIAVLTDAVATPYHALTQILHVQPGETVVVFGVGGIGSNAVQIAAHLGCRVIAVSRSSSKRDLATRLGADAVVVGGENAIEHIRELTGPRGPEVVIQTVGSELVDEQAFHVAGISGRIALVGISTEFFSVRSSEFIWREVSVMGSRGFTPDDIRNVIELHRSGAITVEHLVEHPHRLDTINVALDDLRRGDVLRSVITFGDGW